MAGRAMGRTANCQLASVIIAAFQSLAVTANVKGDKLFLAMLKHQLQRVNFVSPLKNCNPKSPSIQAESLSLLQFTIQSQRQWYFNSSNFPHKKQASVFFKHSRAEKLKFSRKSTERHPKAYKVKCASPPLRVQHSMKKVASRLLIFKMTFLR